MESIHLLSWSRISMARSIAAIHLHYQLVKKIVLKNGKA